MKKVTFSEENNQLHILITWSYAYRSSRKIYWEYLTIDSCRFRRRIMGTSLILNYILDTNHRQRIFNERFSHTQL